MSTELTQLMKNALKNYDNQNIKYKKYISDTNININRDNITINFNNLNEKFEYQILGCYFLEEKTWVWGWMFPHFTSNEIILSRKLLDYGLKQNVDNIEKKIFDYQNYIKTQLVNSRFIINKNFQLDINLAICSFLLKDKISFIYERKTYLTKNKYYKTYILVGKKI